MYIYITFYEYELQKKCRGYLPGITIFAGELQVFGASLVAQGLVASCHMTWHHVPVVVQHKFLRCQSWMATDRFLLLGPTILKSNIHQQLRHPSARPQAHHPRSQRPWWRRDESGTRKQMERQVATALWAQSLDENSQGFESKCSAKTHQLRNHRTWLCKKYW